MFTTQMSAARAYFRPIMGLVNGMISQPFFFHLTSVVFHIATAVLIFYLFKRFFKENIAFFLSLIFLVHPANVEAVCFASALQEVLFTFTGILGLYLFVRGNDISPVIVIGAIILSTMALLMKETGIVFFALIFCYLFLFHRKNTSTIQLYGAFAIIALFTYGMARFSSGNNYVQGQGLFPIMRVSLATRLINIPLIILYYLGTFLFPLHLGIAQHWVVRTMDFWHFWAPIIIELGLCFWLIYLSVRLKKHCHSRGGGNLVENYNSKNEIDRLDPRLHGGDTGKQQNIFLFFFLWFLIGLLPHLQLIPLNMTVAERWMYFPMIGLLGMIGTMLSKLQIINHKSQINFKSQIKSKTIFIFIISLFFVRSFTRALDWRNGLSLYGSTITRTSSFDMQNNMGVELFRVGKYKEAKKYFEISTHLAPYWWVNWNNLGAVYEREQNFSKAQECYERAIHNGQYVLAYENLAKILVLHGKDKQKAEAFLKKALEIFPDDTNLRQINGYSETER